LNDIRVTYSGLIAFTVAIIGVITGTIFVIIVTRKLNPEDFGLWTLIGSLVGYVTIVEPIVTYWTTRQIARGERIGKTAISTSAMLSIAGFITYFGIAIFVSYSLKADLSVLLVASFLVPITFFTNILESISLGYKPQNVSFGSLSFEITKIPLGIIFVVIFPFGIIGALIATMGAGIIRLSFLIVMTKEHISGIINKQTIKFWIKMSWLTIYQSIYGLIYKLDVLIFSLLTESLTGLAYWGAAAAISNLVVHSRNISQGLFPKLLSNARNEIAEENFKRTMYFAIPLLGATIVFAKPIMHVLNPVYVEGYFIGILITLRSFSSMVMGFFLGIFESFETVDLDKQAHFRKYVRSNLFLTPTLMLILSGTYIIGLTIFLFLPVTDHMNDIDLVTVWSYILLFVTIGFTIITIILVKKKYAISIPLKEIGKYSIVTLLTSLLIYYIVETYLEYSKSVYEFIPQLIPIIIFGGLVYFGITYVIDNSTKILFKSIFKEILKK